MAITYASNVFAVSGACTQTDLQNAVDANPANGMYEAGGCVFRAASLTFASGASLSINDGTTLVFDDSGAYRCNLVYGSTIDFKSGGGIVYNGNVQHSFFNGAINGSNITYRINANTVNGRGDFFSGATSTAGLSNINLVLGGGASGFSFYIHLQGLGAYPISNVKMINDIRVASGQLVIGLKGIYSNIVFPKSVSNYGIPLNIGISLIDSAGATTVINYPTFYGSSLSVINPVIGNAELIDEIWPDVTAGTVGTVVASYGSGTTTTKRKITWTPGTYVGWNTYLADNQSTPTVYQNGLISSSAGIKLNWQTVVTVGNPTTTTTTTLSPFRLTARKLGYVEQYKTFSPVQPLTEAFIAEVDSYYTSNQSALTNVAANSATKVLTLSSGAALVLDQVNDWFDSYLIAQLAAIPQTPKSNSGTVCTLTAWAVSIATAITAGAKLKTLAAAAVVLESSADITGLGITGNVTQATPTALSGVTVTGDLTFNTNSPVTVIYSGPTIVTGTVSNTGTGLVTITLADGSSIGTVGTNVTTQRFANISAPNLLAGSRVRIYDVTNAVEIYNGVLATTGLSYDYSWSAAITIQVTATYVSGTTAKLGFSATALLPSEGVTILGTQEDDTVYNTYAINGSTVTGYTADYVNNEINLTTAANFYAADIFAWWVYNETTEEGIRNFFGGITAVDAANIQTNTAVVDLYLDNITSTFVYQMDTIRFYRDDGAYPARTVTSGGGGIDVNWKSNVYVVGLDGVLTLPQFIALQNE